MALNVADPAAAADQASMPVKAPAKPSAFDWSGFYFGGHVGYATGASNWSASKGGAATPTLAGSLDLFNNYNAFNGSGSHQFIENPGYNRDRGPVSVIATRLHAQF